MSQPKQPPPPAYRLIAGDELGVLRVVEVPAGPKWADAAMAQKWGEADKERAVCSLCCSTSSSSSPTGPGEAPVLLAVGRKGRRVELLDACSGSRVADFSAAAAAAAAIGSKSSNSSSQAQVAAMAFIPAGSNRPLQLVVGTSDGVVSICSSSSSSDGGSSSSWGVTRSFETGGTITCLAVDGAGSHVLLGFEGQQPALWELSTASRVWLGKGGKPNKLGLVDKAHTTAVAFLPSSSSADSDAAASGSAASGQEGATAAAAVSRRFMAGSVSAKLQMYDTAAGRRPQLEVVFGETRVTALAPESNGTRVWAANGTGHIQLLDLQQKTLLDSLRGAGGSVRALALNPAGEPRIASAGLDRFLRVHDTTSRAACCRVYLKQQLTAVCWLPVPQPAPAAAGENEAAAAEAAPEQAEQPQRHKKRKGKGHTKGEGGEGGEQAAEAAAEAAAAAAGGKKKRQRKPAA